MTAATVLQYLPTPRTVPTAHKPPAPQLGTGTRKPTPYNIFMSTEFCRVKKVPSPVSHPCDHCSRAALGAQLHPDLPHKEIFRQAATNWATSEDNPKRIKKAGEATDEATGEPAGEAAGEATCEVVANRSDAST